MSKALESIALDGFAQVELTVVPGFCPHIDLEQEEIPNIEWLQTDLSNECLSVVSLNVAPGRLQPSHPRAVQAFYQRSIDLAVQLGVQLVTIPPGRRVQPEERQSALESAAHLIGDLADYAQTRGVVLSVESPHLNTLTEDVSESVELFRILSDDRIKCTFDTSHVFRGERVSLLEGLDEIGLDRVGNVHLRDVLGDDISITPGKGHADFAGFLAALRDRGYEGPVVIELECDHLADSLKRSEIRFAKRYISSLWSSSTLPLGLRVRTTSWFQLLERLSRDPKRELRKLPWLVDIVGDIKNQIARLKPPRMYDGYWRNKWFVRKQRPVFVPKAESASLVVPDIPTAAHQPIRVCIHGSGFAGTRHGLGFRRLAGVKVVGICDIDVDKANVLGQRLGCASYTSLNEMIEAEKPNLVSICTREWQHYQPAKLLLESGIDVFCEKIMAAQYSAAREMVELARAHDRVLALNYNYRFLPGVQKLREVIQSQRLGCMRILDIKAHALSYHHALDLVSFLGGRICSVQAIYHNEDDLRPANRMDWSQFDRDILYVPSRNLSAIFELEDGTIANVTSSYFCSVKDFILSIDAIFDYGAVALTGLSTLDATGRLTWTPSGRMPGLDMNHKRGVFTPGLEYSFYKSIESFVQAYLQRELPETPGEQGVFIMRLEKAIAKANMTGQKVSLR